MRTDFTPDNIEFWMSNWKRKDQIDGFVRQWLDTFDFERVNLITNHSSVTIEDFRSDIRPKVKIWNNVMRHDDAVGPTNENYNQAYVHTFLSGKKYCICAHDNMLIEKGWDDIIRNTDYDLYIAPQGDQVLLITLDGLKTYGWWDERYATNHYHELDYIMRVLRLDILGGINKASIVDYHPWRNWPTGPLDVELPNGSLALIDNPISTEGHPEFSGFPYLKYNSVGLENVWKRANKKDTPESGEKLPKFKRLNVWNAEKWGPYELPHFNTFEQGPLVGEVNWYPWLDLDTLEVDKCEIR